MARVRALLAGEPVRCQLPARLEKGEGARGEGESTRSTSTEPIWRYRFDPRAFLQGVVDTTDMGITCMELFHRGRQPLDAAGQKRHVAAVLDQILWAAFTEPIMDDVVRGLGAGVRRPTREGTPRWTGSTRGS